MIGTTLGDIRQHLEALADETGPYYLRCGRTGEHPAPAIGLRFENRPTARAGARATEQYRAALRQYDPQLPRYDVIVCQDDDLTSQIADDPANDGVASGETGRRSDDASETTLSFPPNEPGSEESLIDFCHAIAGSVFETVAESSHRSVERAIMDTYLEIAETVESPDELCLRLLESMAIELERQLEPGEQAPLLLAAAQRLSSPPASDEPLEVTLSRLQSVALLEDYTLERIAVDRSVESRSWTVTLAAYALGRAETGVVTLPIVIELLRYCSEPNITISSAESVDNESTWEFVLTTASNEEPSGLVSVPPE
ncbi:DUF7551 domain-containing protein [Halostagnicola bangensis]